MAERPRRDSSTQTGDYPVKHRQECRCGSVIEVEDDDREQARADVQLWRAGHICMPKDQKDAGRQGAGFAQVERTDR